MPIYKIFDMDKVREEMTPAAEIQRVKGELMKAGLVTYQKGEGAPPHYHPNDEQFVLILEGRRVTVLDGEVIVSGPGDLIHIPRNTVHGGGRTVDEETVAFAVKSPAGSGVMGEDYNLAENADELLERVEKKWKEIMEKESTQ
ncbi:cupin domain-containing protein [Nitrospinota bacterium]